MCRRLVGKMPVHIWEQLKQGHHTHEGAWDTPAGVKWLAIPASPADLDREWELSDVAAGDPHGGIAEEPDHGPNPITLPMPDNEWEKIQTHQPDPDTGLMGKPNHPTYRVVGFIEGDQAKVICEED